MAAEPDWAVELNNFLQGHQAGNLTPFFRYALTREGPDNSITHIARAMFHNTSYGQGMARSIGAAKREAARQALGFFQVNGVPGHDADAA